MTQTQSTLLASSPSLIGLIGSIERFYCGTPMTVNMEAGTVIRKSDGKTLSGVRVVCKKNRFRFEMEA